MTDMNPLIFLAIVLLAAVILMAVVAGPNARGRQNRGGRGGHSGGGHPSGPQLSRAQIAERWSTIQAMAAGGGNGLRQAVSEADKLMDAALRQQGVAGNTMGDRLKAVKPRFAGNYSTYDGLWRAHKLRNALAHEVGFDLVPSQAREALSDFEAGMRYLGAL